jgi:hypothetical protein
MAFELRPVFEGGVENGDLFPLPVAEGGGYAGVVILAARARGEFMLGGHLDFAFISHRISVTIPNGAFIGLGATRA